MSEAALTGSLFSRVAIGIVVGFLLLHGGTVLYLNHEKMVAEAGVFAAGTAERALTIAEAAREQPDLLGLLSTPAFELSVIQEPLQRPDRVWPHSEEIGAVLTGRLTELGFEAADEVRFWYAADRRNTRLVLQLPWPGGWLIVRALGPDARGHTAVATVWTTLLATLILFAVLAATRRFTRLLPEIADAAEQVGRTADPGPLESRGPRELKRLIAAFNTMQARVKRLLAERNTMLGAVSHDIRTLVTRLKLRLESMPESETRAACERDIDDITVLLSESLDYARNEATDEQAEPVDLNALLETLADDWADQGSDVSFSGAAPLVATVQPAAMRRALGNLLENALRYGGSASIRLSGDEHTVHVDVIDPGEGFEPERAEQAMAPFERLEGSRSRHTGGAGLGLAIARRIVERHRGTIDFRRERGGFRVRVSLPV